MDSQNPRVSIGMPVYNGERFIATAVQSLLEQDFTDFELIICDNASTDRTYEICEEMAGEDPRVRLYRNEQNIGLVPNYNRVVDLARGDYFKWAADDDWCAPGFLGRCVAMLDADPDVALVHPQTVLVDDEGAFLRYYDEPVDASSQDPKERFLSVFWNLNLSNMLFGVMRTNALREAGLHPFISQGDTFLLAKMALSGRIEQVPEPLFYRRLSTRRVAGRASLLDFGRLLQRGGLFRAYLGLVLTSRQLGLGPRLVALGHLMLGFAIGRWPRRIIRSRIHRILHRSQEPTRVAEETSDVT